ncbi:MAG: 5-bromo-4-chloroindolyl phosphate hydrolysis family protein, partial [Thiotrichaceae bacterium]|nr:5-bromo-4-chloroindolyl phosphate hydrolysis family protein [Thiotrichaceae bacterium]
VKTGIKGTLLFLMPLPVLIAAVIHLVKGNILSSLTAGALFAGFMVAATVARHGFKLESKLKQKKFAKAPRPPFKSVAALILSISTGLTAFLLSDYSCLGSILMGGVTMMGFYLAYGMDPRRDKTGNISLGVSADEIFEALEAAEIKIETIETARKNIRNIEFDQHLKRIISKARGILTLIEEDPKDLARARKFLKVYLDGTARVTESYAKTHGRDATTEVLDSNFQEVLNSIETTFDEQHKKLLENDQFDLDVKIEVLKTQLNNI